MFEKCLMSTNIQFHKQRKKLRNVNSHSQKCREQAFKVYGLNVESIRHDNRVNKYIQEIPISDDVHLEWEDKKK